VDDVDAIGVRLSELSLRRPRQWGACWLALRLWQQLELDSFWRPRLARAQGNTPWLKLLKTLVTPNLLNGKRDANADTVVEWRCAASIGVSIGKDASQDDVLEWADAAMCEAQRLQDLMGCDFSIHKFALLLS